MLVKIVGAKGHVHFAESSNIVCIRPAVTQPGAGVAHVHTDLTQVDLVQGHSILVKGTPEEVAEALKAQLNAAG